MVRFQSEVVFVPAVDAVSLGFRSHPLNRVDRNYLVPSELRMVFVSDMAC